MLSLVIGIPLAFGLARGTFRGRALIENGISAPIIVPHIVLSIAIYGLFSRLGLIGEWYGIAIAHTVLALPFVVIVLLSGLRDFDVNLELAARGLGAGHFQAARTVTLPILAPSVYSAAFLAFITSFDELVVAMFISGANMTLPKKMFDSIMTEIDPTVAAVSAMQIVLVSALLLLGTWLRRPIDGAARALDESKPKGQDRDDERHSSQGLQADALLVGSLQARTGDLIDVPRTARVAIVGGGYAGFPVPSSWRIPESRLVCSKRPSLAPAPARAAAAVSVAASISARASPAR